MENASKALIMAGGVLIGVLIISLAVYLFVSFGQVKNLCKEIYGGGTPSKAHPEYYKDGDSNYLIEVYWNNKNVAKSSGVTSLKNAIKTQQQSGLISYKCSGISYNKNGRVNKITFTQ